MIQEQQDFPASLSGLAGNWRYKPISVSVPIPPGRVQVCGLDSERWSITLWTTAGAALLFPDLPLPAGWTNIPIASGVPLLTLTYRDFGSLIGGAWWCSTGGAATQVSGILASWSPQG